jgi:MFS family permease
MPDKSNPVEKIIVPQTPDMAGKVSPFWLRKIAESFPAFLNRNYRYYFLGQLISMTGTWLQIVAQGWLVLQLTHSPFLIGLIAGMATLPSLLFTLFGGVIADRFQIKKVLHFTQSAAMALAITLGLLTLSDQISLPLIGIIAFLLGTVNSVDAPARQAFVSEIVKKEELPSAIALNSGAFNAARAIGPGVAGILIASVGTGWAFILNGISYLAVIIALVLIQTQTIRTEDRTHPLTAIRQGLQYSFTHPVIRILLVLTGLVSVFGWSYTTLLPLIAKNVFGGGAKELGYFYAAAGIGSVLAALLVAIYSGKKSSLFFITGGNCVFTVALLIFTFTQSFYFALFLLFMGGAGLISMASTVNLTIQRLVRNEFRGRVMSIYVLMFIGFIPLGNFQIGYVSEHFGTSVAIRTGSVILLVSGLTIFAYRNKINAAFRNYNSAEKL